MVPPQDDPVALLTTMALIRSFEERVSELVATGDVGGLVHLGIGQEAVAAGLAAALRPDDPLYVGHRGHGHFLARGSAPGRVLAEIIGRADGLCRGKGGSMHLVDLARGLMGATGVVGGNIPEACGTALAMRETGTDRICAVVFGDGAVQAGHFHESLNLAALWSLPLLFVCENNGFAEFTTRAEHTPVDKVIDLAGPYGIPAVRVDGNDVLAVRDAARTLAARVRAGAGPALIECMTYRLGGHYVGDQGKYREAAASAEWLERDPLSRLERDAGLDATTVESVRSGARDAVEAAVRYALASPWPAAEELTTDVLAGGRRG